MGVEDKVKDFLVYGQDKPKVHSDGKLHASDYYCSCHLKDKEYVQAEVFWPLDIDMHSFPYCRECADYMKARCFLGLDD